MRPLQTIVCLLIASHLTSAVKAAKKAKRTAMPTWEEIGQAALDTFFEDVPQRLAKEFRSSHEAERLAQINSGDARPSELAVVDISSDELSCDFVVNQLLLHITQFKSIFYFLVNGWYLGQLGDYASCRTFTNNGQYVLATIKGDYTADYSFTRGSYGKYIPFSTQMGLCIPKQCSIDNVKANIEPLLLRYAQEAHWENPTVEYSASWQYVHNESRAFDTVKAVGLGVFGVCLLIVAIGSCVELSTIGDNPEFDKEVLKELNRFKSTDQYEAVIMQQKLPWARYFVALSAVRNINKMNLKPYQMRRTLQSKNLDRSLVPHLAVFNGIKAIACFYVLFASSFLFTWYAYLADPSQVANFKQSYSFLFIYCVYFAVSVLFLTAGFLQTFNFLEQDAHEMFKPLNLLKFYAWRLFKFMPLLAMVLCFSLCVIPFLGSGPIWSLYAQVMAPCSTYWWTVLLQINNVYPRESFDEKCMPWAWFIPALTQLSFLLPIFVAIYQACLPRRTLIRVFFGVFLFICCAIAGGLTYYFDEGAMPVSIVNDNSASGVTNQLTTLKFDFYNDVFMLSPFHLGSYFAGFCLAIIYRRYLLESELNKSVGVANPNSVQISRSTRFFALLIENAKVRYTTYVVGTILMLATSFWVYPFMANAET